MNEMAMIDVYFLMQKIVQFRNKLICPAARALAVMIYYARWQHKLKVYPIAVAEWLTRLTAVREDPGSNHTADGCVYRDSRCDIQPWAQAVHLCCSA